MAVQDTEGIEREVYGVGMKLIFALIITAALIPAIYGQSKTVDTPINTVYGTGGKSARINGFVKGRIVDQFGATLPGTPIVFVDRNGMTFRTKTDESGSYRMGLPYGNYTARVKGNGFKNKKIKNLKIPESGEVSLDISVYLVPTPII